MESHPCLPRKSLWVDRWSNRPMRSEVNSTGYSWEKFSCVIKESSRGRKGPLPNAHHLCLGWCFMRAWFFELWQPSYYHEGDMPDLLRKAEKKEGESLDPCLPLLLPPYCSHLPLGFLLREIMKCLYCLSHWYVINLLFATEIIPDTNDFEICHRIPQICY